MVRKLKDYTEVSLKTEDLAGRIDFSRLFGRFGPVHIEIGCGKAAFLINQAKAQPQVNFIGIEWASKFYRFAVDRIGRWKLKNVKIIRTDAASLLEEFIPDGSVECFHIYFPDPWPKKRHHKRRFINEKNLQQLLRCLQTGGIIRIATDHDDYFGWINKVLASQNSKIEPVDFLPVAGAEQGEWVGTNFERKYVKENRPIHTIAVRKK